MKVLYRKILLQFSKFRLNMYILKILIFEWIAIIRKRRLYRNILFEKSQSKEINELWLRNFGKSISLRWHKLYQSINDNYNKYYFPDVIFSTVLEPKLNPIDVAKFLSDKSLTELLYSGIPEITFPQTIIVNCSGYFYDLSRNIISIDAAKKSVLALTGFVIKPTLGGSSGNGVQVIDLQNKTENEKKDVIDNLFYKYSQNFIVQLVLEPHSNFSKLYPESINTVRLITYILKDVVYHAPLSLRMGRNGNKIDNIHTGGIGVGVSDDGYLKKYGFQLGYSDSNVKFDRHPDTGVIFENYWIPATHEMIKMAKKLHSTTPHLGVISWDLMINRLGKVVLVEGNYYGQAIWFPQIVHGEPIFGENTEQMMKLCKKQIKGQSDVATNYE